jgi:single-strand DNA-binding protein
MASVNKVILVGNLGADPELKHTATGTAVVNFNMATTDNWTSKDGNKEEKTEWHHIVAWGRLAEICSQYLAKGKQVYIEGKLQTRSWEDRDGKKRYTTEVLAQTMQMLGPAGERVSFEKEFGGKKFDGGVPQGGEPFPEGGDDDIPF